MKKLLSNHQNGWRMSVLLLMSTGLYALVSVGVYALYWQTYHSMMGIWGITAENIVRAPGWVQLIYRWSGVMLGLMQSALLVGGAQVLKRLLKCEGSGVNSLKGLCKGGAIGSGMAIAAWGLMMLIGCVRLGWRLSRPNMTINTFALILTTGASALGEGYLFFKVVFGEVKKRLPKWAALVMMAVLGAYMTIFTGSIHPLTLINGALSACCCALLAENGEWMQAAGFRFGWNYLCRGVLGFAGAESALYESYPVNLYWLNGGNLGPDSGLLTTLMLAALLVWLGRRQGLIRGAKIYSRRAESDRAPS